MFSNFISNLPNTLDPVLFSVGDFQLRWYSFFYIVAFLVVAFLSFWRIGRGEGATMGKLEKQKEFLFNLLLISFLGMILGARIGYGFFYDWQLVAMPWKFFNPFENGQYVGIYGMSFFGGLAGAFLSGWLFCFLKKENFFSWLNFIIPAVPLGYFFGRLGNFFNGELFGKETGLPWGMYFPSDELGLLRHPSQLYEAFFEGLVIFLVLWALRNSKKYRSRLFLIFLFLYGFWRFLIEFVREEEVFGLLTKGQYLSLGVIFLGTFLYFWHRKSL